VAVEQTTDATPSRRRVSAAGPPVPSPAAIDHDSLGRLAGPWTDGSHTRPVAPPGSTRSRRPAFGTRPGWRSRCRRRRTRSGTGPQPQSTSRPSTRRLPRVREVGASFEQAERATAHTGPQGRCRQRLRSHARESSRHEWTLTPKLLGVVEQTALRFMDTPPRITPPTPPFPWVWRPAGPILAIDASPI
jgi:hypothetical protein